MDVPIDTLIDCPSENLGGDPLERLVDRVSEPESGLSKSRSQNENSLLELEQFRCPNSDIRHISIIKKKI